MTGIQLNLSSSFLKGEMTDATHLLVTSFSIRSYCQAAPLFQSYNLGQNKWNIWTTRSPISLMPKWRVLLLRAFIIALGGKGVNCSHLFCPRLWGPLSAYCLLSQSCELLREVRGAS